MTEIFTTKEGYTNSYTDVELISTTNARFDSMVGTLGKLEYRKGIGAFFDTIKRYVYTSVVKEVDLEEHEGFIYVTLTTLNSIYKFKVKN